MVAELNKIRDDLGDSIPHTIVTLFLKPMDRQEQYNPAENYESLSREEETRGYSVKETWLGGSRNINWPASPNGHKWTLSLNEDGSTRHLRKDHSGKIELSGIFSAREMATFVSRLIKNGKNDIGLVDSKSLYTRLQPQVGDHVSYDKLKVSLDLEFSADGSSYQISKVAFVS